MSFEKVVEMHEEYLQSNARNKSTNESTFVSETIKGDSSSTERSNDSNYSNNNNNYYDPDIHFPILLILSPKKIPF